jgi:molecular chaperone GrpE
MTWKLYRRPSESGGPPPEGPTEDSQAATPPDVQDTLAQLQAELAAARSEARDSHDRYLRKAAEFENFRKRTDREKTESATLAKSSVLSEILPIVDACERALSSFPEAGEDLDQYRHGFQLLYKQLNDALSRIGVTAMEVRGEKFDPHLHEALSREETDEYEENTILEELQRGYLFKGRLLRPAQVKVATRPRD